MNIEQLRNMIENQRLEPYTNEVDWIEVEAKTIEVTNLIVDTLREEYKNACCAEDWFDYYIKVCFYVRKLYKALMAISNRCWGGYLANVEQSVEFRTKKYLAENHEDLKVDKALRISLMTTINNMFRDFVFTFFDLDVYIKNHFIETLYVNYKAYLDIEK